ncbi:MAG: hypothetical protein V4568_13050 [Pseudomonadota bacterium]
MGILLGFDYLTAALGLFHFALEARREGFAATVQIVRPATADKVSVLTQNGIN